MIARQPSAQGIFARKRRLPAAIRVFFLVGVLLGCSHRDHRQSPHGAAPALRAEAVTVAELAAEITQCFDQERPCERFRRAPNGFLAAAERVGLSDVPRPQVLRFLRAVWPRAVARHGEALAAVVLAGILLGDDDTNPAGPSGHPLILQLCAALKESAEAAYSASSRLRIVGSVDTTVHPRDLRLLAAARRAQLLRSAGRAMTVAEAQAHATRWALDPSWRERPLAVPPEEERALWQRILYTLRVDDSAFEIWSKIIGHRTAMQGRTAEPGLTGHMLAQLAYELASTTKGGDVAWVARLAAEELHEFVRTVPIDRLSVAPAKMGLAEAILTNSPEVPIEVILCDLTERYALVRTGEDDHGFCTALLAKSPEVQRRWAEHTSRLKDKATFMRHFSDPDTAAAFRDAGDDLSLLMSELITALMHGEDDCPAPKTPAGDALRVLADRAARVGAFELAASSLLSLSSCTEPSAIQDDITTAAQDLYVRARAFEGTEKALAFASAVLLQQARGDPTRSCAVLEEREGDIQKADVPLAHVLLLAADLRCRPLAGWADTVSRLAALDAVFQRMQAQTFGGMMPVDEMRALLSVELAEHLFAAGFVMLAVDVLSRGYLAARKGRDRDLQRMLGAHLTMTLLVVGRVEEAGLAVADLVAYLEATPAAQQALLLMAVFFEDEQSYDEMKRVLAGAGTAARLEIAAAVRVLQFETDVRRLRGAMTTLVDRSQRADLDEFDRLLLLLGGMVATRHEHLRAMASEVLVRVPLQCDSYDVPLCLRLRHIQSIVGDEGRQRWGDVLTQIRHLLAEPAPSGRDPLPIPAMDRMPGAFDSVLLGVLLRAASAAPPPFDYEDVAFRLQDRIAEEHGPPGARPRSSNGATNELKRLRAEIASIRAQLRQTVTPDRPAATSGQEDDESRQRERQLARLRGLEQAYGAATSDLDRRRSAGAQLSVEGLRRALAPGEKFLSYYHEDRELVVFVVDPQRPTVAVVRVPDPDAKIPGLALELRRRLAAGAAAGARTRELRAALARQLIATIEDRGLIRPGDELTVVLQTRLVGLPLEVLASSRSDREGDGYVVKYVASASRYLELQDPTPWQLRSLLLVVADPKLMQSDALPDALRSRKVKVDVLRGAEANLDTIKARLAGHRYDAIQILGHGFADAAPGSLPVVRLAAGALSTVDVLALPNVPRLVVLPGCRTAYGERLIGSGEQTMAQAFLDAGAVTVLGTRWDVNPAEAERVISLFYIQLEAGQTSSKALRNALRQAHSGDARANFALYGANSRAVRQ